MVNIDKSVGKDIMQVLSIIYTMCRIYHDFTSRNVSAVYYFIDVNPNISHTYN